MSEAVSHWAHRVNQSRPNLVLIDTSEANSSNPLRDQQPAPHPTMDSKLLPYAIGAIILHVAAITALVFVRVDPTPPIPPEISFVVAFEIGGTASGSNQSEQQAKETVEDGGEATAAEFSDALSQPTDPGATPAHSPDTAMPIKIPEPNLPGDHQLAPQPIFQPWAKPPPPDRPKAEIVQEAAPQAVTPSKPALRDSAPLETPITAYNPEADSPIGGSGTRNPSSASAKSGSNGRTKTLGGSGQPNSMAETNPGWRLGSQHNPAPKYPYTARVKRWQGRVVSRVLVDSNGRVDTIGIAKSTGRKSLDNAAVKVVRSWIFEPGTRNGFPAKMTVMVPIEFRLTP